MFGVKLYNEFVSDISVTTSLPQSPNFTKVFNSFEEEYLQHYIIQSKGIKDMMLGFIYFEYAKDLISQMTPYGNVKPESENSVVSPTTYTMMYNRYNESVRSYNAIQRYIYENRTLETGQVVTFDITAAGSNYSNGTFALSGGSGSGATVTLTVDGGGAVTDAVIDNAGKDYQIGDTLTVNEGDNNLILTLTYIGKGDFSLWNGRSKQMTTWL